MTMFPNSPRGAGNTPGISHTTTREKLPQLKSRFVDTERVSINRSLVVLAQPTLAVQRKDL